MKKFCWTILGLLFSFSAAFDARAQLVADGATATVNGTSKSVGGDLTVGTNGSFTTLIFTNAGTCTNTGNGVIGLNSSAKTNKVIVTGAGSRWGSAGNLLLGSSGSFSSLIVSNGGGVVDNFANIAFNGGSGNCTAVVTGANSLWTNQANVNIGNTGSLNVVIVTNGGLLGCVNVMAVGNGGANNQLIVGNGGVVVSGTGGRLGVTSASIGNVAVVAGSGSQWVTGSELDIGLAGSLNQMRVTNGGTVASVGAFIGANAVQGGTGSSNLLTLSGAGSTWNNFETFGLGDFGSSNQMVISNGAVFNCMIPQQSLYLGTQSTGSNNLLVVTGSNSIFSGNSGLLAVGQTGSYNRLLVANGGEMANGAAYVGQNNGCDNNLATVTDAGSLWTNSGDLQVGGNGSFNGLIVTNGATVADVNGIIGNVQASLANEVVVTGTNSLWTNSGNLYVGMSGGFSELVIANSGTVATPGAFCVGLNSTSANNMVFVAGTLLVTDSGAGVVEVRRGTFTMNSGSLMTDEFLLTNGTQSGFVFNGGTMQVGVAMVTNGSVFTVGNGSSAATLQLDGSGTNSFANGLLIASNGLLTGNGLIVGNVTNAAGGSLFSGPGIAQFTINGNLTLSPGSTNTFELNKSFNTFTRVLGINSLTYGGTLVVSNLGGTLAAGNTFKLFTASNYSGAFSALAPAVPRAGLRWSTSELGVDGTLRIAASPTPPPRITSAAFSDPTHLAIHASGGVPYEPVYLYSATNVSVALTNWSSLATNSFDASGGAVITAPFSAAEPRRFFVLKVQ